MFSNNMEHSSASSSANFPLQEDLNSNFVSILASWLTKVWDLEDYTSYLVLK